MIKRILACILFLLWVAGFAYSAPKSFVATVASVVDVDTLQLERGGKLQKVRLHGVDAPEEKQEFGAEAKAATTYLALGKTVYVEVVKTDQYGRTVGVVTLPGKLNLNHELVKRGLAWWYKDVAPDSAQLPRLQEAARNAKLGVWSKQDSIPPWEFRNHDNGDKPSGAGKDESKGAQSKNADIVYVGQESKCYHRENCCTLKNSTKRQMSRSEAIKAHFRPCKMCKPK